MRYTQCLIQGWGRFKMVSWGMAPKYQQNPVLSVQTKRSLLLKCKTTHKASVLFVRVRNQSAKNNSFHLLSSSAIIPSHMSLYEALFHCHTRFVHLTIYTAHRTVVWYKEDKREEIIEYNYCQLKCYITLKCSSQYNQLYLLAVVYYLAH